MPWDFPPVKLHAPLRFHYYRLRKLIQLQQPSQIMLCAADLQALHVPLGHARPRGLGVARWNKGRA